jgi:hypothetical protein
MSDSSNTDTIVRTLKYPLRRSFHAIRHIFSRTRWAAGALTRVARTGFARLLRRSDYDRWGNPANFENWWETRTQKMATHVPMGARVIEFGAGNCRLRTYLDESCTYIPSDIVDRGPGTVICDLNHRPLPDLKHLHADVALCAGVLEYVNDLESVVSWLGQTVKACVVSYDCAPLGRRLPDSLRERLRRLYYGYLSDLTEPQLLALFRRHAFQMTKSESWTSQRIFAFAKVPEAETQIAVSCVNNHRMADINT